MPNLPKPPPRHDVLAEFFSSSQRTSVPVRWSYLQQRDEDDRPLPGPLAKMVRRGSPSLMDQYLLLLARAAGRPNEDDDSLSYDVALPAKAWARVLGLGEEDAALRTVGRNWKTLQQLDLVSLERRGRTIVATPKKEDGHGAAYVHPADEKENYLQVPFELWLDGYADELKTPAWAMLLIARSLKNWFPLPDARGPEWYGIGASTVERGFKQLRDLQLIERKWQYRPSFLEEQPWTKENRYRLRPPLDREADQFAPGTTKELKDEPPPKPATPPTTEGG